MFCQKYYFKIIISVGYMYSSLTRLLSFALVLVSSFGIGERWTQTFPSECVIISHPSQAKNGPTALFAIFTKMTSKRTNPYAKSRHQWIKTLHKESTGLDPCQRFREQADPSVVVHCGSETGLLILSEKYHTGSVESLINNNRALFWQAIGWEPRKMCS